MGNALRLFNDEKVCFKCNELKPLTEFYKHPQMGDGHLNKCKDCTRRDTQVRATTLMNEDPSFLITERARGRDKYHRLYKGKKVDPDKKRQAMQTYWNKYPEKARSRNLIGSLPKLKKGLEYHHWSYNVDHAKDVIVISIADHNKLHRYLTYDQGKMMFRTLDGTLLCTREMHEKYIDAVKLLF